MEPRRDAGASWGVGASVVGAQELGECPQRLGRGVPFRLPHPLEHLAYQPRARCRRSWPVTFSQCGDEAVGQAATAAARRHIIIEPDNRTRGAGTRTPRGSARSPRAPTSTRSARVGFWPSASTQTAWPDDGGPSRNPKGQAGHRRAFLSGLSTTTVMDTCGRRSPRWSPWPRTTSAGRSRCPRGCHHRFCRPEACSSAR